MNLMQLKLTLATASLAAGLAAAAEGTAPTGTLVGTVKDPSGAVIPGASVTVLLHHGRVETVETDAKGQFTAANLPAGRYAIRVHSEGFSDRIEAGLEVLPGQATEADSTLALRPLSQTITVTAD